MITFLLQHSDCCTIQAPKNDEISDGMLSIAYKQVKGPPYQINTGITHGMKRQRYSGFDGPQTYPEDE